MRALLIVATMAGMIAIGGAWDAVSGQGIHPAAIHQGTCDAPGPVLFVLAPMDGATVPQPTPNPAQGPPPAFERVGPAVIVPLWRSEPGLATDGQRQALAIYDAEVGDRILACGTIDGGMTLDTVRVLRSGEPRTIPLAEQDQSGVSGLAVLDQTGEGVTVTIYFYR